MSTNTKIEWADHTFNPWIGCTQVGPGCDNCYAKDWDKRFAVSGHAMRWGAGKARTRTKIWSDPVKWNKHHDAFFALHGRRQRVFCASLADVFDNAVDEAWRTELFTLIRATPNLDWLLLTKRIGNAHFLIGEALINMEGDTELLPTWPWSNVSIGATVGNQEEADRDIPKLLATPAATRFLSIEPMLGPIDLPGLLYYGTEHSGGIVPLREKGLPQIDWVIAGGESGPGARPSHPDWYRSLRDQCAAAGVPFLFKQWGEWAPDEHFNYLPKKDENIHEWLASDNSTVISHSWKYGKKAAGRLLDGIEHNGFPS